MNTAVTNDLSEDGYSWSQAFPIHVDQHGKIIIIAQKYSASSKRNFFVFSNDGGINWIDNPSNTGHDAQPGEAFFERGAFAYDSAQNAIHALWITINPGDGGVIYRRYDVVRDTDNNITAINRTVGVSVVIDGDPSPAAKYQHPIIIHLADVALGAHGALVACWAVRNNNLNEIRASMCVLGASATAGGAAGNWIAPVSASTTTIGQSPQVAYSALAANNGGTNAHPSLYRKKQGANANDLYLFYHDGNTSDGTVGKWRYRRAQWSAANNNWSNGLTAEAILSPLTRDGTAAGYTLNYQLGSMPIEDTINDRVFSVLQIGKATQPVIHGVLSASTAMARSQAS